ncbi:MAG: M23 family metallopeptidase, partial [Candidatus Hydrothermarchaeales archaeon]
EHLKEDGILVSVGDKVQRGDIIALSGDTGGPPESWIDSKGRRRSHPHLHYGVRGGGHRYIDPYREISNTNSKSYWINDNNPLCLSEDGTWKIVDIKNTPENKRG